MSENESEIEKLSEALKKKDEKEKKYQGVILYIEIYSMYVLVRVLIFSRVNCTVEHHCRATS